MVLGEGGGQEGWPARAASASCSPAADAEQASPREAASHRAASACPDE